jgi:hypothetical protein
MNQPVERSGCNDFALHNTRAGEASQGLFIGKGIG